jgi:hypothetical protein
MGLFRFVVLEVTQSWGCVSSSSSSGWTRRGGGVCKYSADFEDVGHHSKDVSKRTRDGVLIVRDAWEWCRERGAVAQ